MRQLREVGTHTLRCRQQSGNASSPSLPVLTGSPRPLQCSVSLSQEREELFKVKVRRPRPPSASVSPSGWAGAKSGGPGSEGEVGNERTGHFA